MLTATLHTMLENHTVKLFALIALLSICVLRSTETKAQNPKKAGTSLDSVTVVTGQYQPQSLKKSVYQVRVVDQQRIKLSGATNILQALNNQLGIRFSNDNTLGVTDIELMGMSGRSIKILLDGIPLVDRNDTKESLAQIDIQSVERIEIVEGPMSVIYGSDALAGVINIVTKPHLGNSYYIQSKVQEETAGKEYSPFQYHGMHVQSLNSGWNGKHLYFAAGLTRNDFNGFGGDQYGRGKTWLPKQQWLANARIGYHTDKMDLYYRLDYLDEKLISKPSVNLSNIPDSISATSQYYKTQRYLHQLQGRWHIDKSSELSGLVSYTDYKRNTETYKKYLISGKQVLGTGAGEQDVTPFNYLIVRPAYVRTFSEKISLQTGMDINREKASGNRIDGSPAITDYALFVSTEYKPTTAINIRPGLRFVKNSKYDAPPVIPSLNTKFSLNPNMDLRLSYGRGFRAPALRELYFDFVVANHSILGNPNLKAETSNSFTGSLIWTKHKGSTVFSGVINGFYNIYKNRIEYGYLPVMGNVTTLINVGKYKTAGTAIELKMVRKQLSASIGFSYIGRYNLLADDSIVGDKVKSFSFTPDVNSNIVYTLEKSRTAFIFFYKYNGPTPSYQLSSDGKSTTLVKILDYHWVDCTVTQPLNNVSISAGIKNLFDVKNTRSTGAVNTGVHSDGSTSISVGYGRSYFLSLSYNFSKNK